MAENEAPRSYRDPLYAELAAQVEAKEGLPAGLLSSVINYGERSNADQVSGKGARTVAQIIPATRKAALDKFGIDAYLSPQNALTVAGKLLRESLDRNGSDPAAAVSEYHGGTNREKWGPVTQAYRDRVMSGLQATKTKILSGDFGKWLEANPATPATAPAAGPTGPSPLDAGFAQWLQAQPAQLGAAQTSAVDQIPGQSGPVPAQPTPNPEPHTLAEKLAAAGKLTLQTLSNPVQAVKDATEMVASVGTGLTTGAVGMASGTVQGMVENAVNGQAGTPEAAANVGRRASQGADALTYKPQSPAAQEAVQTVGRGMQDAGLPLAGISGELATLARGAASAAPAVQATTRAGASAASEAATAAATATSKAAQAVRDKAVSMTSETTRKLIGLPEAEPQAAGQMGSVGAAGTDPAAIRRATAQQLPVPMELTTGQATRNHQQLRFEGETAKGELGQPLRENAAKQNVQLAKNFEALIDSTGAEAPNVLEAGRAVVDNGLVKAAAKKKAEYRAKFIAADKAGETETPVSTAPLVQYLKENASLNQGNLAGGALGLLERELVRLGALDSQGSPIPAWTDFVGQRMGEYMKSEGGHGGAMARISREWQQANGNAIPETLSLKNMELLRRQMNNAIDAAPDNATNMRAGAQIKELIDQSTEGKGGDLYKEARAARQRYAQLFENNAIVADLLRNRRGMADRQVALEDVFRRTILNGSREDLSMLRRTLQVAGGEEGHQAWRELQGQTLRHMLDEATKGVGSDIAGNPIFSPAKLQNAIRALDVDGRLEFVLGKQRAQMVRDINEIAKVVTTVPPGALNTSNTASVILAAIAEAGATGGLTGLPIPVLSTIRLGTKYVRDRAIRQRVLAALGKAETSAKKVKAPKTVVPKPGEAGRMPESRTVH